MLISNNYSPANFTALKVQYAAQENLIKLPKATLQKLYRFGHYVEDTKHVDVEIQKDLTPCIKGKLQKEGGIMPPFTFIKPEADSTLFKIKAKYKGQIPYGKKLNGDTVELNLTMRNPDVSQNLYKRFNAAQGDFEKSGLLTKLLDNVMDDENIKANIKADQNLTKNQVIDNIMSEFGTWNA